MTQREVEYRAFAQKADYINELARQYHEAAHVYALTRNQLDEWAERRVSAVDRHDWQGAEEADAAIASIKSTRKKAGATAANLERLAKMIRAEIMKLERMK